MSDAYLCAMLTRVIALLAIVAITVLTTTVSGHAARMNGEPAHAVPVGEMMHGADGGERSCDTGPRCGSTDAAMCEFVCAGLSAILTSPGGECGHVFGSASHDLPSEAIHVCHAPGLNERPPKLRLL
ncbi:hypothetical protein [Paracoccus salsus]|uniref:hypothetical protein n=1 Tax=Paracoccus salsus TaxID=2911061 RepID=UPI001F2F0B40|nr:hypothetical protein [Paracoccus salsus]